MFSSSLSTTLSFFGLLSLGGSVVLLCVIDHDGRDKKNSFELGCRRRKRLLSKLLFFKSSFISTEQLPKELERN